MTIIRKPRHHKDIDIEDFLSRVNLHAVFGEGKIKCLWHDDTRPSMEVYNDHLYCFSCGVHKDGIDYVRESQGVGFLAAVDFLKQYEGKEPVAIDKVNLDPLPKETILSWAEGHTDASRKYLADRGITVQMTHLLSLGWTGRAISIPYVVDGKIENVRFRVHPDYQMEGESKYTSYKGRSFSHLYPYDLFNKFFKLSNYVCLCEGPFDAIILIQAGIPALAVPSITSDLRTFAPMLSKFKTIYLCYDQDDAGQRAVEKLGRPTGKLNQTLAQFLGNNVEVIRWNPEWGKDVSEARIELIPFLKREVFNVRS